MKVLKKILEKKFKKQIQDLNKKYAVAIDFSGKYHGVFSERGPLSDLTVSTFIKWRDGFDLKSGLNWSWDGQRRSSLVLRSTEERLNGIRETDILEEEVDKCINTFYFERSKKYRKICAKKGIDFCLVKEVGFKKAIQVMEDLRSLPDGAANIFANDWKRKKLPIVGKERRSQILGEMGINFPITNKGKRLFQQFERLLEQNDYYSANNRVISSSISCSKVYSTGVVKNQPFANIL